MRSKRYWVWAALLAGLWASPAVAQPHWITFHIGGELDDAQAVKLTYWINDTCRPDEMGHIAGFSYQEAPGKPLNLQVYCRKGDTGKLGKIKVVRSAYPSEFLLEIPLRNGARRHSRLRRHQYQRDGPSDRNGGDGR